MNKKYQVEIQRTDITPRAFWGYCRREIERRTGGKASLEDWLDEYGYWTDPVQTFNIDSWHEDWEHPRREICKIQPYKMQFMLECSYNFIMEFQFWDDKTGNGYLWMIEWDD